jgi:hypothetical protein
VSAAQLKISEARLRIQELGYLQMDLVAAASAGTGPQPFILDKSKLNSSDYLVSNMSFVHGQSTPGVSGIVLE